MGESVSVDIDIDIDIDAGAPRRGDDDLASSSRTVVAAGLDLHFHELGRTGQPVLFLHGGGPGSSGWSDFGPTATALAERCRCFVLDLPQYGRSEKPFIEGPAPSFHAGVVRSFMRELGIDRASLVCQSIGGVIALRLAIDAPEVVDRLVLNGTQPIVRGVLAPLPMKGRLGGAIWNEYYGDDGPSPAKMRHLLQSYEWFDASLVPDEAVDRRYRDSIADGVAEIAADLARRGSAEDLVPELHRVEAPTLLVWGQRDCFGGLDVALLMMNHLPDVELHVLPRCGHHPQEEMPERYVPLVETFLFASEASDRRGANA